MTTSTFETSAGARHPALITARRPPSVTAPPTRRDNRRPGPHGPGSSGPRPQGPGQGRRGTGNAADAPAAARRAQPHWWFADRLVEVLSGRRPVGWMLGHTSGEAAYERLWQLASQGVLRPPKGRPTPLVRRCGYRAPAPGVREAFARVCSGDALRALAGRRGRGADPRGRGAGGAGGGRGGPPPHDEILSTGEGIRRASGRSGG
ncbi:Rv3235 family protein, partial [Streptomyces sp. NPDC054933]